MTKDYYKILDIPEFSTQDEIKSAYRKLARKWHPDVEDLKKSMKHTKSFLIKQERLIMIRQEGFTVTLHHLLLPRKKIQRTMQQIRIIKKNLQKQSIRNQVKNSDFLSTGKK